MLRDETIRRVIQFRDDREWRQFHTPKDLAISLSLEAAELLEIFQWSGADLECRDKLGRIRDHLDGLLIDMAANLYSGKIDAEPLCVGNKSPCAYCDFRTACAHRDGEHERTITIKDDPFAE